MFLYSLHISDQFNREFSHNVLSDSSGRYEFEDGLVTPCGGQGGRRPHRQRQPQCDDRAGLGPGVAGRGDRRAFRRYQGVAVGRSCLKVEALWKHLVKVTGADWACKRIGLAKRQGVSFGGGP